MSYVITEDFPATDTAIPLIPLRESELASWLKEAAPGEARWIEASGFQAKPGELLSLPDEDGNLKRCLFGMQEKGWLYQLAAIQPKLPAHVYTLECSWTERQIRQAALGWGLATYRFGRYRKESAKKTGATAELLIPADMVKTIEPLRAAQCLVRDLVNTPTEHMGPAELSDAVVTVADRFGAETTIVSGADLLTDNFPAIHAVGRASASEPRLVQLTWGDEANPLLALVGKGVCFDTGGLDIKNSSGMILMKKDMGGAAHVLALASLVMAFNLPVRLLMLIPAVENSIAGNAYRPGDVIPTRKGLQVEIGNTDAEGRVVLSDALALACEQNPDLVIDFATLTGAARVALGPDLPPVFSNDTDVAKDIVRTGDEVEDPMWVMPLYQPYNEQIKSKIADINNSSTSSYGGCITAALFLEHFVEPGIPWVHIDTFAWNQSNRAGRPEGGEALGLRAVFEYLQSRYA